MGIPPHAARLAGAWAEHSARPAAAATPPVEDDRSRRRIVVARILHPLHRPDRLDRPQPASVPTRVGAQNPLGAKPARPA